MEKMDEKEVFVLMTYDYGGNHFQGVFSSREKAEEAAELLRTKFPASYGASDSLVVEPTVLDKIIE